VYNACDLEVPEAMSPALMMSVVVFAMEVLCVFTNTVEEGVQETSCMVGSPNCLQHVDSSGLVQSKTFVSVADEEDVLQEDLSGKYEEDVLQEHISGSVQAIPQEMQDLLDRHNMYRCMHNAPALVWDEAIAANAQSWANQGLWAHSTTASPPANVVDGASLGENLAWGSPARTGLQAVNAWYAEVKDTHGGAGLATSMSDKPTSKPIGHYTQVVWKSSARIGCGKAKLNDKDGDYWVCQYGPLGNMGGQFEQNVLAASKGREDCGGVAVPDYANCIASQSVKNCHPCLYDSHCEDTYDWSTNRDGMYCCPRMKTCVSRVQSSCYGPTAGCNPRCPEGDFPDQRECESGCNPSTGDTFTWAGGDWTPEKWIGVTSCGGATPSPTAPGATPSPTASSSPTPSPTESPTASPTESKYEKYTRLRADWQAARAKLNELRTKQREVYNAEYAKVTALMNELNSIYG